MNNTIKMLFLLVNFFTTEMLSQQPSLPYLRQVEIKCAVRFDPIKKIYFYSYSVRNGVTSNGEIGSFKIDVSRDSISAVALDNIGLLFVDIAMENIYKRMYTEISNSVVPIGFPSLPQYGDGSLSWDGMAVLTGGPFKPGQERHGFVMSSKGLPSIRNFVAVPPFDPYDLYPRIEEVDDPDSLNKVVEKDREAVKFRGNTIGPSAPPLNFIPTAWCDTLISYKHQAVTLGWLRDRREGQKNEDDEEEEDGIVAKLDKRLDKVRAELVKGDSLKARKELEKFVKKVEKLYKESKEEEEEDKNKPEQVVITSEGFALLKYNAEYLIDRLP